LKEVAVLIVMLGIAAMAVASPIAAAVVVSIASRREDARWSVGLPPSDSLERLARRIVAFDADSIVWPRSKAQVQMEASLRRPRPEAIEPRNRDRSAV
jgi:hypothetical protein